MTLRVAADIGGTKIAAALVGDAGIVERRQAATPTHDPDAVVGELAALLGDWAGIGDGIAVAVTGIVRDGCTYAVNKTFVDGWDGFPLVARLQARLLRARLPAAKSIYALNDAAAAAWAEYRARDAAPAGLAFITVSTGVGGGIVLDGRLLQGPTGLAGHVGHIRVAGGPPCGCGRQGCAEAIASGTAIAARAAAVRGTPISTREVFARAAADPRLDAVIAASAQAIARVVVDLKMTLDIDVAVIGGSVGLAPGYLDRVAAAISQETAVATPRLETAVTGADAGLLGAADWAAGHHAQGP